jgi:hypothetical protein
MYIFKRSSLGNNKVKIFISNLNYWTGIVYDPVHKNVLWVSDNWDIRKLKRRMRRAGWIK